MALAAPHSSCLGTTWKVLPAAALCSCIGMMMTGLMTTSLISLNDDEHVVPTHVQSGRLPAGAARSGGAARDGAGARSAFPTVTTPTRNFKERTRVTPEVRIAIRIPTRNSNAASAMISTVVHVNVTPTGKAPAIRILAVTSTRTRTAALVSTTASPTAAGTAPLNLAAPLAAFLGHSHFYLMQMDS